MNPIETLGSDVFNDRLGAYLETSTATSESSQFEAAIESESNKRLLEVWVNGWDFDTKAEYFDGRGASILIQNTKIDWQEFWEWLYNRTASIPEGAVINFEVHDHIDGKTMVGGPMLLSRVITASGIFEEKIPC